MNSEQQEKVNQEYASKASKMTEEDLNDVANKQEKVFSLLGKLGEKAGDIKMLWSMMMDYKNGFYKEVPWRLIGAIVFAFVYLISPFDVIPDFIPIVGFVDDISVFGLVLAGFSSDIERYKAWKEANKPALLTDGIES